MNCGVAVVFSLAVSSSIIFPMLNQREAFRRSVVASSWGILGLVVSLQCLVMEGKVGGGVGWVKRRRRKSRQEAGDALADVLPRSWGSGPKYFFWGPRTIIPQPPRKLSGLAFRFPSAIFFNPFLLFCFFLFTTTNCLRKEETEHSERSEPPQSPRSSRISTTTQERLYQVANHGPSHRIRRDDRQSVADMV
jgi:hypothetical protein